MWCDPYLACLNIDIVKGLRISASVHTEYRRVIYSPLCPPVIPRSVGDKLVGLVFLKGFAYSRQCSDYSSAHLELVNLGAYPLGYFLSFFYGYNILDYLL